MGKLKVLMLGNGLGIGGTGRIIETIVRYLNKETFDLQIAGIFTGGKVADDLATEGFSVYLFSGDVPQLKGFLKEQKFDVIHIFRRGAYEVVWEEILKDRPAPLVVETNIFGEYDFNTDPYIDYHLILSLTSLTERYLPSLPRNLKAHFWPKYRCLFCPIDTALLERNRLTLAEIVSRRRSLGISVNEYLIGKVGARADITKWSYMVTDMMPFLLREVPNVKFVLQAGPSEVIDKLKRTAYADKFIFLPETTDEWEQASYYQLLDVFIHTSRIGESFGYSIAEAMYYEKPVVVNSTPWVDNAQLELVKMGETGYIANTPESFAAAVATLLKNKEQAELIGQNGRQKIIEEYSPSHILPNLENLYIRNNSFLYFPSKKQIEGYKTEYQTIKDRDYQTGGLTSRLKYRLWPTLKAKIKFYLKGSRY